MKIQSLPTPPNAERYSKVALQVSPKQLKQTGNCFKRNKNSP